MRTWLLALLAYAGCESGDGAAAPGGVGAACGPEACRAGLVCRDRLCSERGAAIVSGPELPPVVTFDVVSAEVADVRDDAGDDDDGEVGEVRDEVTPGLVFIGEHSADTAPSTMRLSLAEGQAAVRQFVVPPGPSQVIGLEVYTTSIANAPACARFKLVVWLPDANGVFADGASWESEREALLNEAQVAQLVAADEGAPLLAPGPVRAGLAYLGPCAGTSFNPWIALDQTGDTSDSFVWAGNWIPGSSLGLSGRWALRLVVGDGLP